MTTTTQRVWALLKGIETGEVGAVSIDAIQPRAEWKNQNGKFGFQGKAV